MVAITLSKLVLPVTLHSRYFLHRSFSQYCHSERSSFSGHMSSVYAKRLFVDVSEVEMFDVLQ